MANGEDFVAAARELRDAPRLDIGVHLTLVGERPLSPAAEVPSLLDRDGVSFLPDYRAFLQRYLRGGIRVDEVEREARRQIERVREAGVIVRHLNSHQHLHALPRVFDLVVRLAQEHGVPYVRLPRDAYPRATRFGRWLAVRALARFAERDRRRLSGTGVRANDRAVGIMDAGRLTPGLLLALLDQVRGLTELVSHPGVDDGAIARKYPWGYRWSAELEALCDPRVRARITAEGIALVGMMEWTERPS